MLFFFIAVYFPAPTGILFFSMINAQHYKTGIVENVFSSFACLSPQSGCPHQEPPCVQAGRDPLSIP